MTDEERAIAIGEPLDAITRVLRAMQRTHDRLHPAPETTRDDDDDARDHAEASDEWFPTPRTTLEMIAELRKLNDENIDRGIDRFLEEHGVSLPDHVRNRMVQPKVDPKFVDRLKKAAKLQKKQNELVRKAGEKLARQLSRVGITGSISITIERDKPDI